MKKIIIIFFGPPGSGKGTQSDVLGQKLKLPVVSPGELLRHEEEAKTKIGHLVSKNLANGKLAPDGIVDKILMIRLAKPDAKQGFILDGYPRSKSQLEWFEKKIAKNLKSAEKIIAIYIDVSDKEVLFRIGGRRVCDCGAAYHLKYNPPIHAGVCDLCGRKIKRRDDDKPKIVKERLSYFHKSIRPILNYFKKNFFYINIDGEQSIKAIEQEIFKKINELK